MNKKANMAIDKTMILILILLVIAIVLIFLFKADILRHLRNIPEFGDGQDVVEEEVGGITGTTTSKVCPVQIGSFESLGNNVWGIRRCDPIKTCKTTVPAELTWGLNVAGPSKEDNFIRFNNPSNNLLLALDSRLGEVENGKIKLKEFLILEEKDMSWYQKKKYNTLLKNGISREFLLNLNEAYQDPNNLICRDSII